jgi:hypothetical protein
LKRENAARLCELFELRGVGTTIASMGDETHLPLGRCE